MFVSSNLGVQLDSAAAVDVSDDQRPIASQQSLLNGRCFGTIRCPLIFPTLHSQPIRSDRRLSSRFIHAPVAAID
jgi:hypothetical protein